MNIMPLSRRTQFRAAGSQKGIHKSSVMSTLTQVYKVVGLDAKGTVTF